MKTINGRFGTTAFAECIELMKSFDDDAFELCLTDPPYNVKIGKKIDYAAKGITKFAKADLYDDDMLPDDYEQFSRDWFDEAMRVSKMLVFTPGTPNIGLWYRIKEPREFLIHYKRNCASITHSCRLNVFEPILCYGRLRPFMFLTNVFDITLKPTRLPLEHPAVKEYRLWTAILDRIKPESVIDPFLGSGTTAQACEELGISYLGIERREAYSKDIKLRVDLGMEDWKFLNRKFKTKGVI